MADNETKDIEERSLSEDSDDSLFEEDYTIHKEFIHLKDKQLPISVTDIIDKASRFIFAEDLVSYISSEFHGLVYSNKIEKCSKTIFSPFNETIKHAVCVIRWQINQQNCLSFEIIEKLNKSHKTFYESFVDAVLSHYSEKGLKSGVFLYYCVYFAELASKCYRPDFGDVLDLAVYAILDAFCMFNEGLYELNSFAKDILSKLKDRSFYLDLWGTQVEILDEQHRICEKPSFKSISASQENKVVQKKVALEEAKIGDKSGKCDSICNLEFATHKVIGNNKEDELKEYLVSLEKLDLVDKSNICESINNLKFPKNNQNSEVEKCKASLEQIHMVDKSNICEAIRNLEFTEKNEGNKMEKPRVSLEQLQLVDKSNIYEAITNLEFVINNIIENDQDNEMEKQRASLEKLQLVDKSDKCEVISNFEFSINKMAEDNKKNEVEEKCDLEEYGTALEQLKLLDKPTEYKIINNLKLDLNKVCETHEEYDVEEYRTALENLKLVDNSKECEVMNNLEFAINKNIERLFKSVGSDEKNFEFSSNENCIALLIDELCLAECEKLSSASESYIFGDFLKEVMSVVNYEASIFSAIYFPNDNQLETDQGKISLQNERVNIESAKCSCVCNSGITVSNFMSSQLTSQYFDEQSENILQASVRSNLALKEQENERKFDDSSYIKEHNHGTFPNSELKESEFEQDQLKPQAPTIKSDENLITEITEYFTRLELESMTKDSCSISDPEVVHDFIGYNAESQTPVISSSLTQQENEIKSVIPSATLENNDVKFTNIESTDLEFRQYQLISQSDAENCDKNANIQLIENFTKLDCKNINDSDLTVEYSPATKVDKQNVECFVIYKKEGEICEEKLKVLKGDSLLFAEDLINYIGKEFYSISYSKPKFEEIRHLSSNALNGNLKHVAQFIHDESEVVNSMVFNFLSNFNEHQTDWYRKYVTAILSQYVDDGLNSDVFLYYCLHFSEIALKLYTLDFPEILDFGICSILDAFCLLKDDWNDFNVAIENLLKLFKNRKENMNSNLLCFYFSDNLERICVNTICDLLKSYTEQKIEMYLNNFMALKNEDPSVLNKTLEISNTDIDNLEQNKSQAITEVKNKLTNKNFT